MNRRIEWIDSVKTIAMIVVVLGHMNVKAWELNWCYSFHMPIFFILSGMTYSLSKKNQTLTIGQFILYKAKGLLWPYLGLNLLMVPVWILNYKLLGHTSRSVLELFPGILFANSTVAKGPTNATWFLCLLFLTMIVYFIMERVLAYDFVKLSVASVFIGALGFMVASRWPHLHIPWHLNVLPVSVFFFYLGVLYMKVIRDTVDHMGRETYFFGVLFLAAGSIAGVWNGKISMHGSTYRNGLLFLTSSIFISFGLVLLMNKWQPNRLVKYIGQNTLIIMAIHCPILRFLQNLSWKTSHFVKVFPNIAGILIFICSVIGVWMIKRICPWVIGPVKKGKK